MILRLKRALRQRVQLDAGPLAPQAPERLVHRDPRQPGGKAGCAAEVRQMRECPDIGFLDEARQRPMQMQADIWNRSRG
jgi:hypothetical protein